MHDYSIYHSNIIKTRWSSISNQNFSLKGPFRRKAAKMGQEGSFCLLVQKSVSKRSPKIGKGFRLE